MLLVANLVSIVTAVSAAVLAYHGTEGWGWFLFVAVMSCHWIERKKDGGEGDV